MFLSGHNYSGVNIREQQNAHICFTKKFFFRQIFDRYFIDFGNNRFPGRNRSYNGQIRVLRRKLRLLKLLFQKDKNSNLNPLLAHRDRFIRDPDDASRPWSIPCKRSFSNAFMQKQKLAHHKKVRHPQHADTSAQGFALLHDKLQADFHLSCSAEDYKKFLLDVAQLVL